MAAILPFLLLLELTFLLLRRFPAWGWRLALLRAFLITSAYLVLGTEILSLFGAITASWLIALWAVPALIGVWWIVQTGWLKQLFGGLRLARLGAAEWMFVLVLLGVLVSTAVVAWFAPPNAWDALTTHMSRVAHWAQQRSLLPYATGIALQNYYPPLPGMMVLQVYVLAAGDRLANFVQWFSMVIALVGASHLAKEFNCGRTGQLLAAAFAVTLPVGIVQASSAMTDYIVAALIVCVAVESLALFRRPAHWEPVLFLGTASALSVLTKPTAYPYLLPFAAVDAIVIMRKNRPTAVLARGAVVVLVVLVLNAGYFWRNAAVYGHPLGDRGRVAIHRNEIGGWRVVVSNALRNACLHAGTPFPSINAELYDLLFKVHVKLGLELADPRTSIHPVFNLGKPSTNEVLAGNPLHALIILVVTVAMSIRWRAMPREALILALIAIASFLIMSGLYKFSIFGSRYHLAFFILYAPVVAVVISRSLPKVAMGLLAVLLLWSSWPWIASVESRPLFPIPWRTPLQSVLVVPREQLYLGPGARNDAYMAIASEIREASCTNVFLMLSGNAAEYPLWVFLGAPRAPVRIEWNVAGPLSAPLREADFTPCAVVCDQSCPADQDVIRGLPLIDERAGLRLYMQPPAR